MLPLILQEPRLALEAGKAGILVDQRMAQNFFSGQLSRYWAISEDRNEDREEVETATHILCSYATFAPADQNS